MKKITCKGLEAVCLNHISDGWGTGTIFLRMLGPYNAVKGIWADLVSADMKKSGESRTEIDSATVYFEKHLKYITVSKHLSKRGLLEMAFLHPRVTARLDEETKTFYVLAPDDSVPDSFFPRLDALLHLPLLPEWAEWLWKIGFEGVETARYRDTVYKQQMIEKVSPRVGDITAYKVLAGQVNLWYKAILAEFGIKICQQCQRTCGHEQLEAVEKNDKVFCYDCWKDKEERNDQRRMA